MEALSRFPVGRTLARIAGQLISSTQRPLIRDYVALLSFTDGSIAELTECEIRRIEEWPTNAGAIPIQMPDGPMTLTGRVVTASVLCNSGRNPRVESQPQLLLILDGYTVLALVPTQGGVLLHAEPLLTCPMMGPQFELTTLAGESVTLDQLALD
jgi:hypothetical protein